MDALSSYREVIALLGERDRVSPLGLPLLARTKGVEGLLRTMSAVAPAKVGDRDEEWNPLSQRPHAPLPPEVGDELGGEITALKEAVDSFTTLAHEMMHVALWEPFFAGLWKPKGKTEFREFSLRAEGYCFFYADVVVSGAVRERFADGEYALDRQTPSNARFHPVRAFHALGIKDPSEILQIYLRGFAGEQTRLWQPKGKSDHAAAIAAKVFEFHADSLQYLDELHVALSAFGCFGEFQKKFCAIPGLPTFWDGVPGDDVTEFFVRFHEEALARLASLSEGEAARIRLRRGVQARAFYALQVRWLLERGRHASLAKDAAAYLGDLHALLVRLAKGEANAVASDLVKLDTEYDEGIRAKLIAKDFWASERWLILPRRAGGKLDVKDLKIPSKDRDAKVKLLVTVAFLVDELTRKMKASRSIEERVAVLAEIQKISALGSKGGQGNAAATRVAWRQLAKALLRAHVRDAWSLPLAAFDPKANRFRELVFSYQ